jgi:asparagine synthase (glutamine-hydrolysing)
VVTDAQWEARAERFPVDPPKTREYYLLRAIFQKHFPSKSAYDTVPRVRYVSGVFSVGDNNVQDYRL